MQEDTVAKVFFNRVRKYGTRTALRVKRDGVWVDISWEEWGRNVKHLAMGLMALGLGEKEHVSLLSENRPEWTYTDLAVLAAGSADVPIYATNIADQVEHILKDSDSRFVVVSSEAQLQKVVQVKQNVPKLEKLVIMDPEKKHTEDWILSFSDVLDLGRKKGDEKAFQARLDKGRPETVATLIYTSGTTGAPKGVMLTHENFISNMRAVTDILPLNDSDLVLSFLPLSHSFERLGGYYATMYIGGTIAYAESIDKVPENIQEVRPTVMCSVPRLYEKMHARVLSAVESGPALKKKLFYWSLGVGSEVSKIICAKKEMPPTLKIKHAVADRLVFAKLRERMGGRLRFFVSGGAPLAREIAEFFHAAGILILEGYGLTETTPVITANRPDSYKLGSVGQPLANLEVRIAPDGEILARGPSVMKGYFNRPEETREVLTDDGWFSTGDIGYLDQDNFLYITDRKKDIIVTAGGKNIAPQNIENLLKLNRYVEQVCVIGDQRKYLTALVVPCFPELEAFASENGIPAGDREALVNDPRVQKLFQNAVDEINAHLARYETVKKIKVLPVEFAQETGELTPTLKVKRKVVSKKFQEQIEQMYSA